jgi:hypothetical protein
MNTGLLLGSRLREFKQISIHVATCISDHEVRIPISKFNERECQGKRIRSLLFFTPDG